MKLFGKKQDEAPRKKSVDISDILYLLDEDQNGAVRVVEDTARRQSTVWACVRLLSEIIAQLPIEIHERQGGSWVNVESHDVAELLAEPNPFQTQHDLISTLVHWSELAGNGYLYKGRNTRGKVIRLLPLEADQVGVEMLQDWTLRYTASADDRLAGVYDARSIFHLRNFGSKGYKGQSTIANHRDGISLAMQLEKHAVNSYKNGLQTRNWIELEEPLGEDEIADFRAEVKSKLSGAKNAGEVPVLHGAKIHPMGGLSAVDAQYIESRKLQMQQIAAIFGVPLFLLNDTEKSTTWGSGLEQLSRAFVRFSLNPRLNRIGQTIVKELVQTGRRQTKVVFDTDQFTLGEFKERMEGYRAGIESGVISPNECREIEGRNPREGGDDFRQPLNIGTEGSSESEAPDPTA